MTAKMRIVGWTVEPVILKDYGDDLESVKVNPQFVPLKNWESFKDGGDTSALDNIRSQIEAET